MMPGRGSNITSYRFGYQGSEKDNEIIGPNDNYSTLFRELDVRLGRWWAVDPKTILTLWESPYMSMGDNPVFNNDFNGDYIPPWENSFKDIGLRREVKNSLAELTVSSDLFNSVYNYVNTSILVYKINETTNTSNWNVMASYSKESKTINFYSNNPHYPDKSAVYEEFIHAGQDNFYSLNDKAQTGLQREVEAKVMKLMDGIRPDEIGVGAGVDVSLLKNYYESALNGPVNKETERLFTKEVKKVASQTLDLYRRNGYLTGNENDLNKYKNSFGFSK